MKLKDYQDTAVKELLYYSRGRLNKALNKKEIVFKAPTGSGKTVVAMKLIEELLDEETVFLWFAPQKLHEQTADKMRDNLPGATIKQIGKDQLGDSLLPRQVVLTNWSSVDKTTNKVNRTTDTSLAFEEIIKNTSELNKKIVIFIDEAHYALGQKKDVTKARELISRLDKDLVVSITATPDAQADVVVELEEVRKEEMIRKEILLNPKVAFQKALNESSQDGASITEDETFEAAFNFRERLAEKYRQAGIDINPLMLIQVAGNNEKNRTASRDYSIAQLAKLGADQASGKVAVWLSEEKPDNLEEVYAQNGNVDYLIFKQAISLGWDCPRSQILLKLRDPNTKNESFEIQTVGRIMRMPEQRYYADDDFNTGFVFHRSKDYKISPELEGVMKDERTTIKQEVKKTLKNLDIPASFYKRTEVENPTSEDIRAVVKALIDTFGLEYRSGIKQKLRLKVSDSKGQENRTLLEARGYDFRDEFSRGVISVNDVYDGSGTKEGITKGERHQRTLSAGENKRSLIEIIHNAYGGNCFQESEETLEKLSLQLRGSLNFHSIAEVHSFLNSESNRIRFEDHIHSVIEKEASYDSRAKRTKISYSWTLPEEEWKLRQSGGKKINEKFDAQKYSHVDCYLLTDPDKRHPETEQVFEKELEADGTVQWWWKNGDNAPTFAEGDVNKTDAGIRGTNLAIGFTILNKNTGIEERRNFLPDYVYMKSGKLHVVEVKGWRTAFGEDKKDAHGIKFKEINEHKVAALEEWRKELAELGIVIVTGFWVRNTEKQESVFLQSLEELNYNWDNMKTIKS